MIIVSAAAAAVQECLVKVNLLRAGVRALAFGPDGGGGGGRKNRSTRRHLSSDRALVADAAPPSRCGWLTRARAHMTRPRGRMKTGATKPARPPHRRDRSRYNNNNNNTALPRSGVTTNCTLCIFYAHGMTSRSGRRHSRLQRLPGGFVSNTYPSTSSSHKNYN